MKINGNDIKTSTINNQKIKKNKMNSKRKGIQKKNDEIEMIEIRSHFAEIHKAIMCIMTDDNVGWQWLAFLEK